MKFITRQATLDDLVLALRICRKRGGEGKYWCRVIGDWYKSKVLGFVGMVGDEPGIFLLGRIKGRALYIRHWSVTPVLHGYSGAAAVIFKDLKDALPDGIKSIYMTVDERDDNTHRQLIQLGFKGLTVKKDWYAKGHDGWVFHYPMGRFDQ